uniref:Receptor-like serine/threonine-protein kinase n=1 Tax=Oryza meridionalis TaxID=40149 RepID=A0A0E0DE58_9ORYZ
MALLIFILLLFSLCIPASSATTDTISAGQTLAKNDKLVSENRRYALGFFETQRKASQKTSKWYLGIWFNQVPKLTPAWVANRDKPIDDPTSVELTIFHDGNLAILNRSTNAILWTTRANITTNNTIVILLSSGNLILTNPSNSSEVFWESFDYPTDTFFPGAKLGWNKITGLNRRIISKKNLVDPATGMYCEELDPTGVNQVLLALVNSSTPYWFSGAWNGEYLSSIPEMASHNFFIPSFVNNYQEKYFTYNLANENIISRQILDVGGQSKTFLWLEGSKDWVMVNAQPKAQCDVYAICGPFTVCTDNELPNCNCIKGFTITSLEDWTLEDRTGGCSRNTPIDCISNKTITRSSDKFYSMPCVRLPPNAQNVGSVNSSSECAQVCLNNCSCTAYSFSNGGCSVWHNELLNIRKNQCTGSSNTDGETFHIRLAAQELYSQEVNKRGMVIGVLSTCFALFGLLLVILLLVKWRNKTKLSGGTRKDYQFCNGIIAFGYIDLQRATNNFTEKLGGGSFGSVFKGFLSDSTVVAVKRLDHACQGEKQFRAEVSSIGIIQHINLVKLIGFCCEGGRRLLVYEHMPNRSLDHQLFQTNTTLTWNIRYEIAIGIARGLAYLHENCQDCIIHCDIKPENILLDHSFSPKIADFGMAKLLGRDFSRVLTTTRGTVGYLAPEWISGVPITTKVDVYSYGMVLLEIISGKRNSYASCPCGGDHDVYFPVLVACKLLDGDMGGLVDYRLHGGIDKKEVEKAFKVACWCIQDDEFSRPTMGGVVQILEGLVEVDMPPMPRRLQAIAGSSNSACSLYSLPASIQVRESL